MLLKTGSRTFMGRVLLLFLFFTQLHVTAADEGSFHLGYELQSYRPEIQPSLFHILSAGGNYHHLTEDTETKIDLNFSMSAEQASVWSVRCQNFFWKETLSESKTSSTRLSLGRAERTWSEVDSLWNLSLIQPIDQWDRFRPSQQGLTGAFLDFNLESWEVHLFASYLMAPENIPNVIVQNGQFQTFNPQSISSPLQTVTILNQSKPVVYAIEYPNVSDVVFRPSVMGSIETPAKSPVLFRLLYAYKPQNYFNFAVRGSLSIPNNNVQVFIKPRLITNQIVAGDLGYRLESSPITVGISGIATMPDQETVPSNYTYAPILNSSLISPWLEINSLPVKASLSYLSWTGGLGPDIGPYAAPGAEIVSSHIFYRNATQLKVGAPLNFLGEGTRIETKWVHEFDLTADWLSGDLVFPVNTGMGVLRLTIGGDLVQATLDSNPALGGEFLADMRLLDRVRFGVQFAF